MKKIIIAVTAFLLVSQAFAAEVPSWKIIPAESKLSFKTLQDGSELLGYFKKFDGRINFDKTQLNKSKVAIDIDVASIVVSLAEASGTVQSPEWLSTKAFPKATFIAEKFSAVGKNNFRADGILTIKGQSAPTSLEFTFEETGKKATATGKTKIKRSSFGVGDKDAKKANGVQDEIEVLFVVKAEK